MNPHAASKPVNPWWIALAVILPTFMEVLDTTIVSVSLPHIAGNLSASTSEATWVQTSYLVANAVVLPASAWFSSLVGRKRFLLGCIAAFTLASLACGAAPRLDVLVCARVLQGAGGGALQPISQAILLETFPPARHGAAMAAYAIGVILAPILGPVLGGWVTDHYSWRWLFYMNLPVGMIAWSMVRRFVTDPDYVRSARPGRIDALGLGLLTLWLGTLQTVLDKGHDEDWFASPWICWFTLVSLAAFLGFIFRELRTAEPVADLRVFLNRNFAAGTVLISLAAGTIYASMTLLPLFLQGLMGYSAFESGLTQAPRGLGMLVATPIVGTLVSTLDARKLIGTGFLLMALTTWSLGSLNLEFAPASVFWPNFLYGAGMSCCMVPLMTVAIGMLPREQMGNATGLFALARNLAGSIGIAVVTAMVSRGAQTQQATLVAHLNPYNPAYQTSLAAARSTLDTATGLHQTPEALLYKGLLQQSHLLAFNHAFQWLAILCLSAIPFVLLLQRVKANRNTVAH